MHSLNWLYKNDVAKPTAQAPGVHNSKPLEINQNDKDLLYYVKKLTKQIAKTLCHFS